MDAIWQFVLDNWGLTVTIILMIVGVVFTGKRLAYFKWANEVLFFAWAEAEKQGILEGIKGHEKLEHYLMIWKAKYQEKFGADELPGSEIDRAVKVAVDLSAKEKVHRLANPQ